MFAGGFGVFPWQDILAGLLGGSSQLIHLAGFQSKEKTYIVGQEKEIEK